LRLDSGYNKWGTRVECSAKTEKASDLAMVHLRFCRIEGVNDLPNYLVPIGAYAEAPTLDRAASDELQAIMYHDAVTWFASHPNATELVAKTKGSYPFVEYNQSSLDGPCKNKVKQFICAKNRWVNVNKAVKLDTGGFTTYGGRVNTGGLSETESCYYACQQVEAYCNKAPLAAFTLIKNYQERNLVGAEKTLDTKSFCKAQCKNAYYALFDNSASYADVQAVKSSAPSAPLFSASALIFTLFSSWALA